jgi:hypothetical protein
LGSHEKCARILYLEALMEVSMPDCPPLPALPCLRLGPLLLPYTNG